MKTDDLDRLEFMHAQLKADIFEFFINNTAGPREFFNKFAERLRVLLNCEQLLYRDVKGVAMICNSPEIDSLWTVPVEYCHLCPHYEIDSPVYSEGYSEMVDCAKGYKGIPTYCKCPIKSSLTRIVFLEGEHYGYLAVHYLLKYHEFTDFERNTLEELTRILSLTVSGYRAHIRNEAYEKMEEERREAGKKRARKLIDFFIKDSESTFSVNLDTDVLTVMKEDPRCTELTGDQRYKPFASTMAAFIDKFVFKADRQRMHNVTSVENLREKLSISQNYEVDFRQVGIDGRLLWFTFTAARLSDDEILLNFTNRNESLLRQFASQTLLDDYISVYYCNLDENLVTEVKHSPVFEFGGGKETSSIDDNVKGLLALADEEYRPAFLKFVSIDHLKKVLMDDSRTEFIYSSHVTGSQRWVKCTLLVEDRRDGVPVNLIMTFANVDKEQAEKIKLNNEIAQLHVISDSFTGSFVSTYYVGLDDFSYVIYKRREYYNRTYPIRDNFFEALECYVNRDVHPEDRQKVLKIMTPDYMREHLMDTDSFSVMYRDLSEGTEKIYRMMIIRGADNNHAAVGFMDITHEIQAEQSRMRALEEANKAKEASLMKSRFVQNISHDIRTPLNAIVGFSQILGMPDGFLTGEEKAEFTEYISDSADMLTMLIDDVLSISDVESGILKIQYADINCKNVCMKAVNCSKMRVQQGVKLYMTSELEDNFSIISDSKRIQQILVNFLSNACKHTVNGEIHLHLALSEKPGFVMFTVTDTGCGVSPEKADKIFKRFESLDSSNTSHGLGLDICCDIATRLGGNIGLDTSYTDGARFFLEVPERPKDSVAK